MEEARWMPWVWLMGAVFGYVLFMRTQPLRACFATAWRYTLNGRLIASALFVALLADEIIRIKSGVGVGDGEQMVTRLSGAEDLLSWIPFLSADLARVFWQAFPLRATFYLGVPIAVLGLPWWGPCLWLHSRPTTWWGWASLIGGVILLLVAAWWCLDRWTALVGIGRKMVPLGDGAREVLRVVSEGLVAVCLGSFFQAMLWLAAYRSHGTSGEACGLGVLVEWTLRCVVSVSRFALVVIVGALMHTLVVRQLAYQYAVTWDSFVLVLLVAFGFLPVCLLLVQGASWKEAFQSGKRFVGRTWWGYAWFFFLFFAHYSLLHLCEAKVFAAGLGEGWRFVWAVVAACARTFLTLWFINAFCLYFCTDMAQRRAVGKRGRRGKNLLSKKRISIS